MTRVDEQARRERWASRWAIDTRPLRGPAYRRLWIGNGVSMYGYLRAGASAAAFGAGGGGVAAAVAAVLLVLAFPALLRYRAAD